MITKTATPFRKHESAIYGNHPIIQSTPIELLQIQNIGLTWSCMLYGREKPKSNISVAFGNFPYLIKTYTNTSCEHQN